MKEGRRVRGVKGEVLALAKKDGVDGVLPGVVRPGVDIGVGSFAKRGLGGGKNGRSKDQLRSRSSASEWQPVK